MALSRVIATGDGSTTQFAISFALGYINESDIQCRVAEEVDGGGDPAYRDIIFINPGLVEVQGTVPANGDRVEFTRTMSSEELLVDYTDGDILTDENLNLSQKQMIMLIHELFDGRFNQFDADLDLGGFRIKNMGDPLEGGDAVTLDYILANALDAGAAAAAAAASAADALASAAEADADAATAAAAVAGTAASASAADASADAALVSETNAAASAVAAAASASSASTSAGTATTQAGTATTQAGIATTQAGIATTQAGNASTSATSADSAKTAALAAQTAAEAALASTLAAYDSFDDRYLGSKAADPTLDNDGNALVGGALYYNSVSQEMRLWTGSAWVAAYVSGGGFLATTGGTMTGDIVLAGDPNSALKAAPKQYVDTRVLKAGDTMTGLLILPAATTGLSPIRIPHGTANSSPTDGDIWTTSADLLVRITGVSYKVSTLEGAQTISGIKTYSAKPIMPAGASGTASINLPHGSAPSAPVNGDLWTTSAGGLFAQVNSLTKQFAYVGTTLASYGITDAAANIQALECISVYIENPTAKSYKLITKAPHGGTITNVISISESGTGTCTTKINTTALGGTANAVSNSEQDQSQGSSNVFSAGDDIVLTFSSLSTLVGATITIKYTRTYS